MNQTNDEICEKLKSKKSADRLSAARRVSKETITGLSAELFAAYVKERQDPRTWEVQAEMIKALGAIDHKPALDFVDAIVRKNIPHDAITGSAATAFVRLKRKSTSDSEPVLELLGFGSLSVIGGALRALAVDRMVPSAREAEEIIKLSWDINKHPDRLEKEWGTIDPRQYLAIACAGWDKSLCTDFLNHCIETANNINRFNNPIVNVQLIGFCRNALKGMYSEI